MSDTLKTIAEWMPGWIHDDRQPCFIYPASSGAVDVDSSAFPYYLKRVIEKLTPDMLRRLNVKLSTYHKRDLQDGEVVPYWSVASLLLPATTLADIVADVIKETT